MQSRRDFLKLLSMAVGASLSGCGGESVPLSSSGTPGPAPLAYQFLPLIGSGQELPTNRSILSLAVEGDPPFMGGVMINDRRHVYFHALDKQEDRGIYRIDVDDSGATSNLKHIIHEGDVLPDGTVVVDFSDGEINNQDDFLLSVEDDNAVDSLQYCPDGGDFQPMAKSYQDLSTGVKLAAEICMAQALSDDGRILFVSDYYDEAGDCEGQGLFTMPVGQPQAAQLVLANDALIPGTSACIGTIGVSELRAGGRYLVQGSASPTAEEASTNDDGLPYTYLMVGQVGETPQLLALAPGLGSAGGGVVSASCYMCPRLSNDSVGAVLQTDPNTTRLWLNQNVLLEANLDGAGTLSPRGSKIITLLPPVFGPGGLVFFQAFTADGMELILYDGNRYTTLLSKGDRLAGKIIETILFGCLPEAVNAQGELVTIVEYSDGEVAILLGIPV